MYNGVLYEAILEVSVVTELLRRVYEQGGVTNMDVYAIEAHLYPDKENPTGERALSKIRQKIEDDYFKSIKEREARLKIPEE